MSDSNRKRNNRRGNTKSKLKTEPREAEIGATGAADGDASDIRESPSLPCSPHRAFQAFNDSVDNVNLEDIRDLLPAEHLRADGHPRTAVGIADMGEQQGEADEERWSAGAEVPYGAVPMDLSHCAEYEVLSAEMVSTDQDQGAQQGHGDASIGECETDQPSFATAAARTSNDVNGDDKYFFGPTQFPARRSRARLLWSLPSAGDGSSCNDRSCVEAAEALLLDLLGRGTDAQSKPSSVSGGKHLAGRNSACQEQGEMRRGALGYVLHTLLNLYYVVFVSVPLRALQLLAALLWSLTTTVFAVAYIAASWGLASALWLALLPVRTAERVLVGLWQRALNVAVYFLNQPTPTSLFANSSGQGPASGQHKHTIPTALNGHVHKH